MNEQILSLLRSIPKDHPLRQVVESVLLPDLKSSAKIEILEPISEYKNFAGIYKRRYRHLSEKNIKNYGILESISLVTAHQKGLRAVLIETQNYQGYAWVDLGFKNLIGLILVGKKK